MRVFSMVKSTNNIGGKTLRDPETLNGCETGNVSRTYGVLACKNQCRFLAGVGVRFVWVFVLCVGGFAEAQLLMPPSGGAGMPTPAPSPSIRPIAPPEAVFPYPAWVVALAVGSLILLIAAIVWGVIRYLKNRPQPLPPTAREVALASLEKLRPQVTDLAPYAFSIEVSDVLRTFVGAEYGMRAKQQTAPEFLAAVAESPRISEGDRVLLAGFLELSDLIKFARMNAKQESSEQLLEQAFRFVTGVEKGGVA